MVFIKYNSLKSDIYLVPYSFHVSQDPCFSRPKVFWVLVQDPGPGLTVGPGFPGSESRVRVQVLEALI